MSGLPEVGDIPVIGPWAGKISSIANMWAEPCKPNPVVWFAAGIVGVAQVAAMLTKPDVFDLAFDRGKQPHKRKRRSRAKPDYTIGQTLGGGANGLPKGFKLAGALGQRVGFYMILIDGTLDGAINATSLAYQWTGCHGWAPGYGHFTEGFHYSAGEQAVLTTPDDDPEGYITPLSFTLPNTEEHWFSISPWWQPDDIFGNPAQSVSFRLDSDAGGGGYEFPTPEAGLLGGGAGTAALLKNRRAVSGTTTYQLVADIQGGNANIGGDLYIYADGQQPNDGIGPDP